MKVYVLTKYKPLGIEAYVGVYPSIKKAEQALRKDYPYSKPTETIGSFKNYKDNNSDLLFTIREEEI